MLRGYRVNKINRLCIELQAWLAQSVERWTFNPTATGSSPVSGSLFLHYIIKGMVFVTSPLKDQQTRQ